MSGKRKEKYLLNSKFCRLVQAYPCIYDRTEPNYYYRKDNSYTDYAWATISKEMNESVEACKQRWKNIRTRFSQSLSKIASVPNCNNRFYLHDDLQFLTKHMATGIRKHNKSRQSIDQSDDSSTFETTLDLNSSSPPPSVVQEQIQEEENVPTSKQKPYPESESEPEYVEPEPEHEEQPPQAKKYRANISNEFKTFSMPQIRKDPDSDFLTSLLPELKTMNSRQKIIFKRKIFQALAEVFSDPRDFQQKHDPSVSESSLQATAPSATQGALDRRILGNKVFTDRRETLPGESSQVGEFSIVELPESHTKIKP